MDIQDIVLYDKKFIKGFSFGKFFFFKTEIFCVGSFAEFKMK